MGKKTGILTFHNSANYGAALQACSLCQALRERGVDAEVLDYVNPRIETMLKSKGTREAHTIRGLIRAYAKKYHGWRKRNSFSRFCETRLTLSAQRNLTQADLRTLSGQYDTLITGSDQVWNLNLTGGDFSYFLDFAPEGTSRIAYAVSLGDSGADLSPALAEIRKFGAVSVREECLQSCLREEYGIASAVCCDPALLMPPAFFQRLKSSRRTGRRYIFCFLMDERPEILQFAKTLAKNRGGLFVIDNKTSPLFFLHSAPEDFLSWIANAEFVLTDSFHGAVFSILMEKRFLSDRHSAAGMRRRRTEELLRRFSLSDRFQDICEENAQDLLNRIETPIDCQAVRECREELARNSMDWLMRSIDGHP